MSIGSDLSLNGRMYVVNDASFGGLMKVSGIATFSDNVNVTGSVSTVNGNLNASKLRITNISTFDADMTITSGNINLMNPASFINQF
jgi:hypothetical protein